MNFKNTTTKIIIKTGILIFISVFLFLLVPKTSLAAIEWNKLNTISNFAREYGGTHNYVYGQNTANMDLFPDGFEAGDAIYFIANGGIAAGRPKNPYKFSGIRINVSTPIQADSYNYSWQYRARDNTWKTLPNVSDPSNGLTVAGTHDITWDMPTDWKVYRISGGNWHHEQGFMVRLYVEDVSNPTEGGKTGDDPIKLFTYAFWIDDGNEYTPTDIYDYAVANGLSDKVEKSEDSKDPKAVTILVNANIIVNNGTLKIPFRTTLIVGKEAGAGYESYSITLNDNENAKIYINGGFLKWNNGYNTGSYHYWGRDGRGTLKIDKGGKFWKYGYTYNDFTFQGNIEAEDASFESGTSNDLWYFTYRSKGYVKRTNFLTCKLYVYACSISWEDVQLKTSDIVTTNDILLAGTTYFQPTFYDFDFGDSIKWVSTQGACFNIVNPRNIPSGYPKLGQTYNKYSVYAVRLHPLHIKIIDQNGNPIQGAKVYLKDKNGHTAWVWNHHQTDGWAIRNLTTYDDTSGQFDKFAQGSETQHSYGKPPFIEAGDTIRIRWEYIKIDSVTDGGAFTCTRNQSYNGYDSLAIGGYTYEPVFTEEEYLLTNDDGEVEFSGEYGDFTPLVITDVWAEDYDYNSSWNYVDPQYERHLNPFTIRVEHPYYPTKEITINITKETYLTISLKDRPKDVGSVKVWGTEYASDEPGTIYAQVFYGDGSPCNTLASSSITATVYKSDGTKIIDGAEMTYVEGSNGIYKYDFPANTFTQEGVYIIDVMASSTDPDITAYASNEIHISKSANLISQNLDQKISEVASLVWSYSGRSLDNIDNIISGVWNAATSTMTVAGSIGKLIVENLDDKISNIAQNVWSYTGSALDTAGNAISKVWSYTGNALDTAGNAIAKVWGYTTRKLTSRQIGENEYIAGVSSSSTVTQVADQPTQENIEYNVELVRKATFDFAGFADSGSVTTLVDSELEGPDNYWQYYKVIFMSGNNFGEERVITSYDADSHTLSWDPDNPLPHPVSTGDKYVLSHEHRLVYKIWSYTDRSLTSVGNIASAVWGWTTRSLTTRKIAENEYIAGVSSTSTVSQVASSEQAEKLIENIIVAEVSVNDSNASTTQFITNLTNSTDDFYNDNVLVFTSGTNAGQVRRIVDYDGTLKKITVDPPLAEAPANNDTFSILSQTAVAGIDAQTIWTYGTRTLTAPDLDSGSLATLADLQKQWTVYLSDFGEVLAGNTYRAKLWVLNYESVPTDANTTPTLTIYDAVRNKVVENVEMTKISTGIYEYTYSVPSSAVQGVWETEVSVEVEAGKIIKRNDYWEVEGSPAQVKINSITDNTIPSISANVTISNEGSAGYEYQYEWCVVSSEENACGGGDDVFYSSAAKYIQAGEDWNTTLNATVSNTGSYWFKVVVYYGTEKSGASQTFTAVRKRKKRQLREVVAVAELLFLKKRKRRKSRKKRKRKKLPAYFVKFFLVV